MLNQRPFYLLASLLRPKQWIKNIFVIAPLVFSHSVGDPVKVGASIFAFLLFSLISSATYIFNDLLDIDRDRNHPLKKERPLAKGMISIKTAVLTAEIIGAVSLLAAFLFSFPVFLVILGYLVLNIVYSIWLKHIVIIDMLSVAMGFVLRIIAGIIAIGVNFSPWIISATFFIAIFLIAAKRLGEINLTKSLESQRQVLAFYTREFIQQVLFSSLTITIITYMFYVFFEVKNLAFLITILPVTYGMFRFLWLVETRSKTTDNPTDILFQDQPLQVAIAIFIFIYLLSLWY